MSKVKQSVNLYASELRPQKTAFSAESTLLIGGIFCVLLCALSFLLWQKNNNFQQQVAETERETNTILQRVAQASASAQAQRKKSAELDQQLTYLRSQRDEKRQLLSTIDSYIASASNTPFSNYFLAIGRQTLDGIWLDHIEIDNLKNQFSIEGYSSSAALVPKLIQQLSREPSLAGLTFAKAQLQREDETGLIKFSLNSSLDDKEE